MRFLEKKVFKCKSQIVLLETECWRLVDVVGVGSGSHFAGLIGGPASPHLYVQTVSCRRYSTEVYINP